MFTKKNENPELDKVINELLLDMQTTEAGSDAYAKRMAHLVTLTNMKEAQIPQKVDANTKAIITANLAGILIIVAYEHAHVVTSKALPFIMKLK